LLLLHQRLWKHPLPLPPLLLPPPLTQLPLLLPPPLTQLLLLPTLPRLLPTLLPLLLPAPHLLRSKARTNFRTRQPGWSF